MKVEQQISKILHRVFQPTEIKVTNESHKHQRHPQTPGTGKSHFCVFIVSQQFQGLNRVVRHRLVYTALSDLMTCPIHALKITTLTTEELKKQRLS